MSAPTPTRYRLILPTLFTLGNAASGFCGILWLSGSSASLALVPWLVFVGWFFDMFDGTIAKAMRATSDFGGQMDSLCDAVTFGMLPALLIATGAGRTPLAMAAGLVYLAAVLVRLARFNSENTHDPQAHLYFKGLPSPAGAMTISAWSLAQTAWQGHPEWSGALFAALPGMAAQLPSPLVPAAFVLASMMVGTRRYADLPKHYFRGLKPWWQLVPILLATVLVPWPLGLVVLTTAYVLGGALAAPSRPASAGEVAS